MAERLSLRPPRCQHCSEADEIGGLMPVFQAVDRPLGKEIEDGYIISALPRKPEIQYDGRRFPAIPIFRKSPLFQPLYSHSSLSCRPPHSFAHYIRFSDILRGLLLDRVSTLFDAVRAVTVNTHTQLISTWRSRSV